ncbi:putative ribonuclease H-like domain-containing protein [Tanacetum coccineum]
MSSIGELTFFLGLQETQKDDGIFISQDKYVDGILKKFRFSTMKTASTPMETSKPLIKDQNAEDVDVHLYRLMISLLMYLTSLRPDIMFAICACARFQITPKVSHLHAVKRIFRYLKVANSTTEAEYVAAASCCGQVLWIQNQMLDYGYNFMNTKIFIDNEITICIVKKHVFHSKTKRIEIRHHFIRDSNEKKLIQMIKIHTDQNVTDLLTKACDTMVAYLEKYTEHANFDEIVDFLNASPIRYALISSGPTTLVADETVHEERRDSVERAATTAASLDVEQDKGDKPAQTRVLALENVKTAQDLEITCLKKRVKKLEKKKKARTSQLKRRDSGGYDQDIDVPYVSAHNTTVVYLLVIAEPSTPPHNQQLEAIKEKGSTQFDEEVAKRLVEELKTELEEEERVTIQRDEEANLISWDNAQAMMEADYELAQRLQAEEQGELTIEERSKLFVELMNKRKKHFAKPRDEKIRRKPPTKTQKRNQMSNYLETMAGYKHTQLKNKSFKEIHMLFDKEMKRVNSFVPMDCRGNKLEDDAKKAELQLCLEIVPKDDEAVNVESLSTKYPIIFIAMLDDFDRQDVLDLYRLIKERFETTSLEGYDRLLWGDLKLICAKQRKNLTMKSVRLPVAKTKSTPIGGYSQNSKAYIILNKHTRKVEESLNVTFDETPPPSKTPPLVDDDLDEEEATKVTEKKNLENDIVDETLEIDEIVNIKESRNHLLENVLVAQGCNQQEGIDYDETYASVARLESIRILLAYACALDFKLFQMDANMCILNGFINEEPLEESFGKTSSVLGCNPNHVPACLCYMLYYVANSEKFNLAYYMAKRMELVTKQARLILPYGMLLTRLFDFIIGENPELQNESYVLYDRVMNPLAAQQERKPRKDHDIRRGRHSTSSSSAFDQPSSSHLNDDDDDGNSEGTSRASTPSPIRYVNSLTNQVPQVFQNPPNIDPHLEPFYTCQTEIINRQV